METTRRAMVGGSLGALLIAALPPARARADAMAPDVVVFCEPTLQPVLAAVGREWRGQTGVPVRFFPSPTDAIVQQASHHIRVDVLVGMGQAPADLAVQLGLLQPDTRFDGWRNRLVVAQRKDTAAEDDGTLAIVDAAVSPTGAASQEALTALGGAMPRLSGVIDTGDAAFLLTHGRVARALVYMTDVAADARLAVGKPVPDDAYPPAVYWVAQTSFARSPNVARFMAHLRTDDTRERLRLGGLEIAG